MKSGIHMDIFAIPEHYQALGLSASLDARKAAPPIAAISRRRSGVSAFALALPPRFPSVTAAGFLRFLAKAVVPNAALSLAGNVQIVAAQLRDRRVYGADMGATDQISRTVRLAVA